MPKHPTTFCERESPYLGEYLSHLTQIWPGLKLGLLQVPQLPPHRITSISATPDSNVQRASYYTVCKCFVLTRVSELFSSKEAAPTRTTVSPPPEEGVPLQHPFPPHRGQTPGEGYWSRPTLSRWGPSDQKQCRARPSRAVVAFE